jgi:hypothetical protein
MQLQDHDSPTRFRNIWIRPLDDKAFLFEPGRNGEGTGTEAKKPAK